MPRPLLVAAAILPVVVAACGGPAPTRGTWTGDVTPRRPGPACEKSRGVAQISGDRLTFTPNEGTWLLIGTAEPGGAVRAEKIGTGANRQAFETRLEGTWTPTSLTGTYTTPRCVSDVALRRQ